MAPERRPIRSSGDGVAAAIPIFNEAATIHAVVADVSRHVSRVVVVDDGSTDRSSELAKAAGATVLRHDTNTGKGGAVQTVLVWARNQQGLDTLVLIDGDGQHDPADIPRMIAALATADLDVLVGSRFLGDNNAPLYRLFGLHVLSASAALGSGIRLTDSQSGYRVLSRRALDVLHLRQMRFAVESEMQFEAAKHGLRMGEVPIGIRYDAPARRSPVVHGVSVLIATIGMTARRRPLRLPLLVAAPVLAVGISRTRRHPSEHGG